MSYASSIISGLELIGMFSGGYIGYRYGNKFKESVLLKYPSLERYRKEYISDKFKNSQISEKTMFNMIGTFVCVLGGYKTWFVFIPLVTYQIIEDYPEEYKKIKDSFGGK